MNIRHILAHKGRNVVTIGADETIGAAVTLLARERIGAVVVAGPDRKVKGIISERDIVRAVASGNVGVLEDPVSRYMTVRVVTCDEEASVNDVMQTMSDGKFRHVPVVEQGQLVGVISIGDVVKHRLAEIEAEHQALRHYIATA